jgi:hypothetical protein
MFVIQTGGLEAEDGFRKQQFDLTSDVNRGAVRKPLMTSVCGPDLVVQDGADLLHKKGSGYEFHVKEILIDGGCLDQVIGVQPGNEVECEASEIRELVAIGRGEGVIIVLDTALEPNLFDQGVLRGKGVGPDVQNVRKDAVVAKNQDVEKVCRQRQVWKVGCSRSWLEINERNENI